MNVRRLAAAWRVSPRSAGLVVLTAGLLIGLLQVWPPFSAGSALQAAFDGGLMAAAATALGTLPVLLSQRISQRMADALLGFGAGVMLAATAFSLVVPALAAAGGQGHGPWAAGLVVGVGMVLGALLLLVADTLVPNDSLGADARVGADGATAVAMRRAWLFVAAITLHNVPEGLAIGVAFAGDDPAQARSLAVGISIQDIPEGLVVALALRGVGHGRAAAAAMGMLSGLVEPVAAVLGAGVIGVALWLLPWGLALAAGAMLCAIGHEAIPGSHDKGNAREATAGLVLGFVLMMLLDTALAPAP